MQQMPEQNCSTLLHCNAQLCVHPCIAMCRASNRSVIGTAECCAQNKCLGEVSLVASGGFSVGVSVGANLSFRLTGNATPRNICQHLQPVSNVGAPAASETTCKSPSSPKMQLVSCTLLLVLAYYDPH